MNFNIDLKNIDLKNISLEDIQAKLKKVEKKTWIKLGSSLGAIIVFLIIFYGVLNPIVNKKKAQLMDMNTKIEETEQFNNKITLFHTRAEVEGLYQTLSEFAGNNNLIISKIEKKTIKEVTKAEAISKATGKKAKGGGKAKKGKANLAYYTIPVDFEITGNFIGYIKFKRQLSLSQKMLNFDKEVIRVVQGDTTGAIKVNGTLTIVGLVDEFF